jgi:pentatricopeptide repeat protein
MEACANVGNIELAFEVFNKMKIDNVGCSLSTYTSLINCCLNCNSIHEALDLL